MRLVTGRTPLKRRAIWAVRSRVSERPLPASAGRSRMTTTPVPSARRRTAAGAPGTARSSAELSARHPAGTTTENALSPAVYRARPPASPAARSTSAAPMPARAIATTATAISASGGRRRVPGAEARVGSAKDEVAIGERRAVDTGGGQVAEPEPQLGIRIGSHRLGREPTFEEGRNLEDRTVVRE